MLDFYQIYLYVSHVSCVMVLVLDLRGIWKSFKRNVTYRISSDELGMDSELAGL